MRKDTRWTSLTHTLHNEHREVYIGDPNEENSMRNIGAAIQDRYGEWEQVPANVAPSNANPGLKDPSPFRAANGLTGPSMPPRLHVFPHEGRVGRARFEIGKTVWTFSTSIKSFTTGRLTAKPLSGKGAQREWEWAFAWDERLDEPAFLVRPLDEEAEARDLPRELREEIVSRWLEGKGNQMEKSQVMDFGFETRYPWRWERNDQNNGSEYWADVDAPGDNHPYIDAYDGGHGYTAYVFYPDGYEEIEHFTALMDAVEWIERFLDDTL